MTTQQVRDRLREFFFMKQAISEAKQMASVTGAAGVTKSRVARSLLAAAESLEDAPEWQLAAVTLLRQAAVLATLALASRRQASVGESAPDAVWNALSELPEVKAAVQPMSSDARERLSQVIGVGLTPEQQCEWSPSELRSLKESLFRVVRHIVGLLEAEILAPRRLRARVVGRWIATVFALSLVIGFAAYAVHGIGSADNLAPHARVSTSSTFRPDIYDPNGLVDGDTTKLGCHTQNEESPWALFDLGSSKAIHRVVVTNRLDTLAASAVPLIVEVSSDGNVFEEFARQNSEFKTWVATGSRTKARYVRLRVPRVSTLHLNEVEIY